MTSLVFSKIVAFSVAVAALSTSIARSQSEPPTIPPARPNVQAIPTAPQVHEAPSRSNSPPSAEAPAVDRVLARVDGRAITENDVTREMAIAFSASVVGGSGESSGDAETNDARSSEPAQTVRSASQRAATLEQLVKRELTMSFLVASGHAASDGEVDRELDSLKRRLEERGGDLDAFLRHQRLSNDGLHRRLAWRISWRRYLDQYATDENLQRYFERRRPHFDGTELRVAHILLKVDEEADETAWTAAEEKAASLASKIRDGEMSFSEAARSASDSPSAEDGGDIGWIRRHEPMPEPFSQAAFNLKANEVSAPVRSPFGVHLITPLESKPGEKPWNEVRDELEQAVTRFLFDWCADKQRAKSRVEYSASIPSEPDMPSVP